jgi:DeoR family transcriptional regulator of aga operon
MDSMESRRNAMVELVNENGTVSFSQIKNAFPNVSEMTLRTDLKQLDEDKKILRIHGGAKSVQVIIGTDDLLSRKSVRNIAQKQRIADKALALLRPDTMIFIDSGSTTTMFARKFPDQPSLTDTARVFLE